MVYADDDNSSASSSATQELQRVWDKIHAMKEEEEEEEEEAHASPSFQIDWNALEPSNQQQDDSSSFSSSSSSSTSSDEDSSSSSSSSDTSSSESSSSSNENKKELSKTTASTTAKMPQKNPYSGIQPKPQQSSQFCANTSTGITKTQELKNPYTSSSSKRTSSTENTTTTTESKQKHKSATATTNATTSKSFPFLEKEDSSVKGVETKQDSSSNMIIQEYQPERQQEPEIDFSLYNPPNYKEKPRPILHRFGAQNHPLQSRKQIPVASLFSSPINRIWQDKFQNFNHLQSQINNFLCHSDDNIVVSAPTGAGKTAIFEMGIARFLTTDLKLNRGARISKHRKIVYIAPSKALCEERYHDWSQRLSKLNLGIEIAMITGDAEPGHCYFDLANSHFILTTPEKWDSISRRWNEKFYLLASVKLVMIDEVHLLGDPSRGCTLEAIVARMKTIYRASQRVQVSQSDLYNSSYPNTCPEAIASCMRVIAVSATLPNIQDVAEFLGANEAFVFDDSYRPVPLTVQVVALGNEGNKQYMFWKNLDQQIPHLIARYSDGKQTLIFCHTKKETELLSNFLVQQKFGHRHFRGSSSPPGTVDYCLDSGVAYHHAGLDSADRKRVEQAFADRKLRCLCATSTLAVGVNLPAHLVIIKGTKAYRGGNGYQDIDPRSMLQMIGRAGRPGLDTSGMAIIMTDNQSKHKFERLTKGLGPADSQLLPTLIDVVNTEISQRVITNQESAVGWIKTTFLFSCVKEDPVRYGLNPATLDAFLLEQCSKAIQQLDEFGIIVARENGTVVAQPACHIMSQSMVPFEAMKLIASLPFDATQCQILNALAKMEMFHFPVRRQEKKHLNACHKSEVVRFKLVGPLSKVRIQEPSQKAFVLLQAYINKQDFQEFALRQEMSMLADKAQRILSASQEYSIKGSKHGQVALRCLKLRRSLQLCLWGVSSGVLNQIQDVGHKCTNQLKINGILSFEQALAASEEKLQQAAGRPAPFGHRLQACVNKIMREKLALTAGMEYTRGSNIPAGCKCHLRAPNQTAGTATETEKAQVNYTLIAYTDQPGSILFFQEGITSAGSFHFFTPRSFGKLYIYLVASVVGLDESCVLDGNQKVIASTFSTSKKAATKKAAPKARTAASRAASKVKPAARSKPKNRSRPNQFSQFNSSLRCMNTGTAKSSQQMDIVASLKKQSGITKKPNKRAEITPQRTQTSSLSPRQPPQRRENRLSEQGRATTRKLSGGYPSLSPLPVHQSELQYSELDGRFERTKSFSGQSSLVVPLQSLARQATYISQGSRAQSQQTQVPAYVSPPVVRQQQNNRSTFNGSSKGYSKKNDHSGSWNQTKRHQQKVQQRAFASKRDNPFSSFQHDPNDAENFLHGLATRSQNSIIPHDKLAELHQRTSTRHHQSYGNPCQPRRLHNRKTDNGRIKRRRTVGKEISNQELLRMKAAEHSQVQHQQQWNSGEIEGHYPQQRWISQRMMHGMPVEATQYPEQPQYAYQGDEGSFMNSSHGPTGMFDEDTYHQANQYQQQPVPVTQQLSSSFYASHGETQAYQGPSDEEYMVKESLFHQTAPEQYDMMEASSGQWPPLQPPTIEPRQDCWPDEAPNEEQSTFRDVFF